MVYACDDPKMLASQEIILLQWMMKITLRVLCGGRKKVMFKGPFVCVYVREKTATNERSGQMDGSSPRPQISS